MDYFLKNSKGDEATVMIRNYLSDNAPHLSQPYIVCMNNMSHINDLEAKAL